MLNFNDTFRGLNFNDRPSGAAIDTLVLHYTGMRSGAEAIARLCDPEARVSAHYVVEEDGRVFALVPEEMRAWHAGISHWRGRDGLNDTSIGIEIVNPGHEFGYRPFPAAQMDAVAGLCREILARHPIPARNVIGHSDIAPDRKEDPGELFDWAWLAAQGIGLWAEEGGEAAAAPLSLGDTGEAVAHLQRDLAQYGYGLALSGRFDVATEQVVVAFQRHFRPALFNGIWDGECAARLASLRRQAGCTD
jgi:N-acetylmuramoyl-L-alanine amidase